MCGIAGTYVRQGAVASRELLLAMGGELRHRGPDSVGLYLDGRAGMVATRLAIVDLQSGDQPLPDDEARCWAVQNGEIYNHVELRAELEELGHRFATASDTEVVAHAYARWGPACLERLNGDFAIAVWDRDRKELFLARDRFGVRPLFVAELAGGIAFASEARALLRHPAAGRSLDPLGLVEAFTTWAVAPDRSAFSGIRELAPAHYLLAGPGGIVAERRWWDLDFSEPEPPARPAREAELAEELLALLEDATKLRLRADVPVAAYLSGGLDSSALVALASPLAPRTLLSFGVGFADRSFDETSFQNAAARALHTELERVHVTSADIAEWFPACVALTEKPTLRTAPVPLFLLSRAVRDEGIKVVLTGEGADELFGGYDIFQEAKIRRFWAQDPGSALRPRLLARLHPYLATDPGRSGAMLRAFYARGLTDTNDPLYSHRIRFANTSRCLHLVRPEVLGEAARQGDPLERLRARLPDGFERFTPLGQAQYLEIATFLTGYLLHSQGDRMLMGNSVEGRFPYLDHRVAELAARLPDSLKLRGLRDKALLRRAVAPLLPPEIATRPKRPYRAPIGSAFFGPAAPGYVEELLRPSALDEAGIFRPEAVARLAAKCRERGGNGLGETDEMAIVGVLSVMLLHEQLVARPALAVPARPDRVVVGARVDMARSARGEAA